MRKSVQYTRVVPRLQDYDRQVSHQKLYFEAKRGNIDFLRAIHHGFGFVRYDSCVTQAALRQQQYEFWKEFVLLSKWTLPKENYPWDARIKVITDLFVGFCGPEEYLRDLYWTVYDTLLLPKPITVDTQSGDISCELEADLYVALALHQPRRSIVHFMVNQKGFRFKAPHLELAQLTFDRDLVLYVRRHMHPDSFNTPAVHRKDPEPNDSDLACMILDAVKKQYSRCDDSADVQFLIEYPHMIDKLYFLIEYLQGELQTLRRQKSNVPGSDTTSDWDLTTQSDDSEHTFDSSEEMSDSDSESDFDRDEKTPGHFYCPDLARQLFAGIRNDERSESPPPIPPLPLEAVRPPKMVQQQAEAMSAPLNGVHSSWVKTQLHQARSDPMTFIEDALFTCHSIFINVECVDSGLQRWDLIDRPQPGPSREPFQADGIPNRVRLLSRRRDWFRQLRNQLIQQANYLQ